MRICKLILGLRGLTHLLGQQWSCDQHLFLSRALLVKIPMRKVGWEGLVMVTPVGVGDLQATEMWWLLVLLGGLLGVTVVGHERSQHLVHLELEVRTNFVGDQRCLESGLQCWFLP